MELNKNLEKIGEDVMGFLNEIQMQYPDAISFASGRPDSKFFYMDSFPQLFNLYVNSVIKNNKIIKRKAIEDIGQYNKAKGIINDLIVKYLEKDENIVVTESDIILTVGTQEGLLLAIMALCGKNDVILIEDPTYIGITHLSILSGQKIEAIPVEEDGISLHILENRIKDLKKKGKTAKIVYVTPNFQNPTGATLSEYKRLKLLEMAEKYDFIILEDNAYGEFIYEGKKPLSLKAQDKKKRVIYMHSFSKLLFPSLRLSILLADQKAVGAKNKSLSDVMALIKGYTTVNTPGINQAILGGLLIKNKFSLRRFNSDKVSDIKTKRNLLLKSLNKYFRKDLTGWTNKIYWNVPNGGFFLTVTVPFPVDKKEVLDCARKFKIIFTPMSFFYINTDMGKNKIRLSFSNLLHQDIDPAIGRFYKYCKSKIIK